MENVSKTKIDRRKLLKLTGTGVVAVAAATVSPKAVLSKGSTEFGMVIDLNKCYGCMACQVSCKAEYNVPLGVNRSWVKSTDSGKYPDVKRSFLPRLCNNCANPPCVPVCPVDATKRDEELGLVVIDEDACIGCGLCVPACPYGSRFLNPVSEKANKCDFCLHRVENGVVPSCVNACPSGARTFGDLNDPKSEASKLIKAGNVKTLQPELGTDPKVFYIDLDVESFARLETKEEGG